jgi:hypothetical protein
MQHPLINDWKHFYRNDLSNAAQHALAVDGSTGGEKHAASFASLALPAQKSRIIQAFVAPATLGAPEALAVGWQTIPQRNKHAQNTF